MTAQTACLPAGLPIPVPEADGLSAPFWEGLRREELLVQRCGRCNEWQWGPEWLCHRCHSFELKWERVAPEGAVYAIQRVWHPVQPALKSAVPYLIALVELPRAGHVRMIGNVLGDPMREIRIGAPVRGVFEHHSGSGRDWTLLQWELA